MSKAPAARAKPGRPPGRIYPVSMLLKIAPDMEREIEVFAKEHKLPKAEAVRQLIRRGLRPRL
jgi:hypothetical protein